MARNASRGMGRRRYLGALGAVGFGLASAGCLGDSTCGPGEDSFQDVKTTVAAGDVSGDGDSISLDFTGQYVGATDLGRPIVSDTTARAILYAPGGYEFTDLSKGDCVSGSGTANVQDNADDERLVILVSSLKKT